jgi:VWFA-related protein
LLVGPELILAQAGRPFITVTGVESHTFPEVTAYVAAPGDDGSPLAGLTAADFSLVEDGATVPAGAVTVTQGSDIQDLRLVLALDISVPPNALPQIQAATRGLLETMGPRDRVALLVFGDTVELAYEFTNNKDELQATIDALIARGDRTALNEAVTTAVDLAGQQTTGRRAVIVITDSRDNTSTALAAELLATAAREGKVSIYPLGFGTKIRADNLESMAGSTGGRAFVFPGPDEVAAALLDTADLLRQGYKITFQSGLKADNQEHALVIDQDGEEAEATFVATPGPVTVTLPALADGQMIAGPVTLTAEATAPGPIVSVEYLLDGQSLGTSETSPYNFEWSSAGVEPGPHTLTARVTDSAGNEGQAEVRITVAVPLTVSVSSTQGQVQVGDQVPITANIEAMAEIAKVEYLMDGNLLGSHTTPPYGFSIDSSQYPTGTHTITVRVEDRVGQQAEDSFEIEFLAPPAPPRPVLPERIIRGLLVALALILAIIAILLIFVLFRSIVAWQKRRLRKRYQLEISNLGNTPSYYELTAKAPGGGLNFQFRLNGAQLPQQEIDEAIEAGPVLEAVEPAAAVLPAGGTERTKTDRLNPAAGLASAKQGADNVVGTSSALADIFTTLGYLLPGSLGAPFRNIATQILRGQSVVTQTTRAPTMAARRAQQLQQQVGRVVPAGAAPARGATAQTGSYRPAAAAPMATASRPAAIVVQNPVQTWAQTPLVEPGDRVTVDLMVAPLKPYQSQAYNFSVTSKPIESEQAPLLTEQGQVQIKGISWFGRLIPILITAAALIAILLLASYGLVWLINMNVSTIPILGGFVT